MMERLPYEDILAVRMLNSLVDLKNHAEVDATVYWEMGTKAEQLLSRRENTVEREPLIQAINLLLDYLREMRGEPEAGEDPIEIDDELADDLWRTECTLIGMALGITGVILEEEKEAHGDLPSVREGNPLGHDQAGDDVPA